MECIVSCLVDVAAILGVLIKALVDVAPILGVLIAAYGGYIASRAFTVYRLQQCSQEAAKALAIVNNFVFYVKEIAMRKDLYQNRDYYPDRIPEFFSNDKETHWERPFRLIFNETNKFRKEFGEAIIKLETKDFDSLNKILIEIEGLAKELSDLLPKETQDIKSSKQRILKWIEEKELWFGKIDKIHNAAKCILAPIINGKS